MAARGCCRPVLALALVVGLFYYDPTHFISDLPQALQVNAVRLAGKFLSPPLYILYLLLCLSMCVERLHSDTSSLVGQDPLVQCMSLHYSCVRLP